MTNYKLYEVLNSDPDTAVVIFAGNSELPEDQMLQRLRDVHKKQDRTYCFYVDNEWKCNFGYSEARRG